MPNERSFGPRPSVPFLCLPGKISGFAAAAVITVIAGADNHDFGV
jgi:hypothetical protein